MIDRMASFGATGDLTGRFLLPALARLYADGHLPEGFRLVGSGVESWDDDEFRSWADDRLALWGSTSQPRRLISGFRLRARTG